MCGRSLLETNSHAIDTVAPHFIGILGLLLGAPLANAQQWVEGKHYFEIKPAQRPPDAPPGVIEVTEVFSYACVYCNRAIPLMDKIKKSLPANARLGYLPASFNSAESWPMFQRVYYTAAALGLIPKMHDAVYSAVWTSKELAVVEADGRRLKSPQPTLEDAAKVLREEGRHQAGAVPRHGEVVLRSMRTAVAPISW